ncbi:MULTISPECIES: transglycosylase SLT domain-containing protein [unclassified Microbacterium]|uniref:aggregation-promoting factor C-terminal-like domain-containing protein n=1 Tax=unclassified Microbacterium TaxID=2609290 RepID=UPI0037453CEE
MTSGPEMTRASRRLARRSLPAMDVVSPAASRAAAPRWSRRRGVLSVFAGVAAVAFTAAWVGPLGGAVLDAQAAETQSGAVSLYSAAAVDSQSFIAAGDEDAAPAALDRSGYTVYVTPKPTPTPTPTPSASGSKKATGGTGAVTARPQYTGGGSAAEWMTAAGIAESDQGYVDYIVKRESGWNPNATNKSSGACGLVQALPCSKVPGNGYDPVDNLRWATGYAVGRYGSWGAAYDFWTSNHWW